MREARHRHCGHWFWLHAEGLGDLAEADPSNHQCGRYMVLRL